MNAEPPEVLTLRRCALLGAILVLIAALRIVSTYTVLSHTVDEPIHLGAGMEWLDHGTMTGDVSHPPMARVLSAIGPWLAGEHWVPTGNTLLDGARVLGHDAHYDRMLALARLGILPLFLLACAMVFLWGNRTGGPLAGLIATFLFTTIPPVLAHAGLVTTDMAATAFTAAGAYAALLWAERPDRRRTVALGVAVGLGMIAKYSLLVFLPAIFVAMYLCHWRGVRAVPGQLREHWRPAVAAAAIACLVIWAGFRFSFGPLSFAHVSLPAPRFFDGLNDVWDAQRERARVVHSGRAAPFRRVVFLPGDAGGEDAAGDAAAGWLVAVDGVAQAAENRRAAGVLRGHPGHRDEQPHQYRSAARAAGLRGARGDRGRGRRHAAARFGGTMGGAAAALLFGLFGWQVVSGALAHPDYLSYTNEITRGQPENFVAESDLDWGQDMHRVGDFLKKAGATEVTFTPYNVTYVQAGHAFPKVTYSDWYHASPGWNVVSLSGWKVYNHPGWIGNRQPQFRIGRTHWAWYFKPGEEPSVRR